MATSEPLKVVVVGGGSGGHITPVLAVARAIKQQRPDSTISYIGQKGDALSDIPAQEPAINGAYTVRAGKLRRYHGEGWRQLFDVPTVLHNLRDVVFVVVGLLQSYRLLRRLKPQVIFTRGSFVSVPVCIAAGWLKIPYVTHDSDAIPGLANRIIARRAAVHAVALPKEVYPYPADKTVTVGVPISEHFRVLGEAERGSLRQRLGLAAYKQVILITGGGNGAQRLNDAILADAVELMTRYPQLAIIHLTGRDLADEVSKKYNDLLTAADRARVLVEGFITNLHEYSAVADVVITRAGGTSIAEFAAQAKACIVVPNPQLTGGHQTKNAQVLSEMGAISVVNEDQLQTDPKSLLRMLTVLLDQPAEAAAMAERLHSVAKPDATAQLAKLLIGITEGADRIDGAI